MLSDEDGVMDTGIETRDAIADIEEQDDAPVAESRPVATTGPALLAMFRAEQRTQSAPIRGPIRVPLIDPETEEPADAVIYYKRLSRAEKKALVEKGRELKDAGGDDYDINWMVFIERARDRDGSRILSGLSLDEVRVGGWNDDAVAEAVYQMTIGSRTILTDADLGNSSTPTPSS